MSNESRSVALFPIDVSAFTLCHLLSVHSFPFSLSPYYYVVAEFFLSPLESIVRL